MDTTGQIIKCKAAVAWKRREPLTIEEVEIDPPHAHEARIKMISAAICRSDLHALDGHFEGASFPSILGHEAAGIVESVGPGVTSLAKGDRVIPCFVSQCNECRVCRSPAGNHCLVNSFEPLLSDGTPRMRCRGQVLYHFCSCSTFAEYAVIPVMNLAKVTDSAPLDKVCLIGCGVGTGYGAAINVAKVTPGSTCAVWGLGAIGLATVMGCRNSGASRIIAVDMNPEKEEIAKKLGATEFFNPSDHSKPIAEVLADMTDGGLDYTFECVGNETTLIQAFDSCHPALGTCVVVGVAAPTDVLKVSPLQLLSGKKLFGTFFGGYKPRDAIPKLVEEYINKKISLDEFISKEIQLDQINEGIQLLQKGKVVRVVINIGKA